MSLDPLTAGIDLAAQLVGIVRDFEAGRVTPEQAIAAARRALGPDPLAGMAAEDAARHARILAEQAAASTRVSVADVAVAHRLAASPMVTDEERAAIVRLASHTAITLGDAPASVVDHAQRVARAEEDTREIKVDR